MDLISETMKEEVKPQLVLFKDAIRHIVRICRILSMQRGHMVLVGVGGSGRRSLAKFAGILSSAHIAEIEVNKKYVLNDFR